MAKLRRIKRPTPAAEKPRLRRVVKKTPAPENPGLVKGECDSFYATRLKCGLSRKHTGKHQHKGVGFVFLWISPSDRCNDQLGPGQFCTQFEGHTGDHVHTAIGDVISWSSGTKLVEKYRMRGN